MSADIVRELTPHTLTAEEGAAVRAGFDLALRLRYQEAHIAVCDLSEDALKDVLLAMDIFGSILRFERDGREFGRSDAGRSLTEASRGVDGNDRLPVRCPRCGHETRGHDGAVCIECPDTRCQAVVLVPAGVEGWPIDGRAQ